MINSVPKNIAGMLPDHISDDYPIFTEFLTAYYNFLNQSSGPDNIIKNILSYNDIDETVDAFRDHIFNELMIQIPNNVMVNRTLLAKHIKELYNKKGTEDSYRLLFRILFDKEISINYPVEQILKLSDGKWVQRTSFICHIPKTFSNDIVMSAIEEIIVVDFGTKTVPIKVLNIIQLDSTNVTNNLYEFFINKDFFDDFNTATSFTFKQIETVIVNASGVNYTNEDEVAFLSTDGGGAHINLITTNGRITGTTIVNTGVGFYNTPILNIISTKGTGGYLSTTLSNIFTGTILPSISGVSILRTSNDYLEGKTYDVEYLNGTGATLQIKHKDSSRNVKNISILSFGAYYPDSFNYVINKTPNILQAIPTVTNGVISSVSIINGGYGYAVAPTATIIGDGVGANITFTLTDDVVTGYIIVSGGVGYTIPPAIITSDTSIAINISNNKLRLYNGEYISTDGFTSSDMVIYDGNYYQQYSYEIVINELFDIYKGALKKILHPAGYVVWGAYDLQKMLQIQLTNNKVDIERNSGFIDIVYYTMTLAMNMSKSLSDSYAATNIVDSLRFNVGKSLSDSYVTTNITETVRKSIGKVLSDSYETLYNFSTIPTGTLPNFIKTSPDNLSAYTTNVTTNNIYQYSRNIDTGVLTSLSTPSISTGISPYGIIISPDNLNVYAINNGGASISQYSRNTGTGLLTAILPVITNAVNPREIAISPDGLFVYVTSSANIISMYSRNTSTGVLTALSTPTIGTGTGPRPIVVSPDNKHLYVGNTGSNTISMYIRDVGTGLLTTTTPTTIGTGVLPYGIEISPDGLSVYAVNTTSTTISTYSRNSTSGLLTSLGTIATGNSPREIIISPNNAMVYVSNSSDNTISVYSRNTTNGILTELYQSTIATGLAPYGVNTSIDGAYLYCVNSAAANISTYAINTQSGRLNNKESVAFNVGKSLSDSYVASNITESKSFIMSKSLSDSYVASTITDSLAMNISKSLSDTYNSANILDNLSSTVGGMFGDSSTPTESKTFSIGKRLNDSSTPTESKTFSIGKRLTESVTPLLYNSTDLYVVDGYFADQYVYVREMSLAFRKVLGDSVTPTESLNIVSN